IGGARQRLSGDEAKHEETQYRQLVRQMIAELEQLLLQLKE
ncbi:MAG: MerR family transcriptional regulator, partial [Pseudomonadales bacterium]|nr:MerR family transcriptional regulator [Pseudomonadales bacterium]